MVWEITVALPLIIRHGGDPERCCPGNIQDVMEARETEGRVMTAGTLLMTADAVGVERSLILMQFPSPLRSGKSGHG
jgi:hypothetical protein